MTSLSAVDWLICLGWMLYAVGLVVAVALGLGNDELIWLVVVIGLLTTIYTVGGAPGARDRSDSAPG